MRFKQFSLRTLLITTGVIAVILSAGIRLLYKPETHKILAYEKAQPFPGLSVSIRGKPLSVVRVSRNDRNQMIVSENGKKKRLNFTPPKDADYINASSWLDVVEIELNYDDRAIEIDRLRIFDHNKRQMLGQGQSIGWRLVDPHRIQLYGLRTLLPETIDIWFDINRLNEGDKVYSMTPQIGSRLDLPGGTLSITDLRNGHLDWTGSQTEGNRFIPNSNGSDNEQSTSMEILFSGDWQLGRKQFIAVTKEGEIISDDFFQDYRMQANYFKPLFWPLPSNEIDRIELRTFPTATTLYFDAIHLPAVTNSTFTSPPIVIRSSEEIEAGTKLHEFSPLVVSLKSHRGSVNSGFTSRFKAGLTFVKRGSDLNEDTVLTLEQSILGIGQVELDIVPILHDPSVLPMRGKTSSSRSSTNEPRSSQTLGSRKYLYPVDAIKDYQIELVKP